MSLKNKRAHKPGQLIILSGPSGAGKTTLHDLFLGSSRFKGRLVRSVSATTRAPRGQEKHGRDYFFLSRKMFEYKIRAGQFLEWARVFDSYYGTPVKSVRDHLCAGKSVLLCIDVQGAGQIRKKVPEAFSIFVKTPTLKDLRDRLVKRGTDTRAKIDLRLKTAARELKEARHYDKVIINKDLAQARRELESVLGSLLGA